MKPSNKRGLIARGGAIVAASGAIVAGGPPPAHAADSIHVTNNNDDGPGSLRQAVIDADLAPGDDVIVIDPSVPSPIVLTSGALPVFGGSLAIRGPGSTKMTISGNHTSQILYLNGTFGGPVEYTLDISGVTISHGNGLNDHGGSAGAIAVQYASLILDDVTLSDNASVYNAIGGALVVYGPSSRLEITNSTISGNLATHTRGGGMYVSNVADVTITDTVFDKNIADSSSGGGIVARADTAILERVTISGNKALGSNGGGFTMYNVADARIIDSKISGNQADNQGGGLHIDGTTALSVTRSTISGNSVGRGGGAFVEATASAEFVDTTVSGNIANTGGGIYAADTGAVTLLSSTVADNGTALSTSPGGVANEGTGAVIVRNSIIAGSKGIGAVDIGGVGPFDISHSLVQSPGVVMVAPAVGNLTNLNPLLAPLADNGGLTSTRLPAPASPAINAGDAAFVPPPSTDQRGGARVVGGHVDMGAVERGSIVSANDAYATTPDTTLAVPAPGVLTNDHDGVSGTVALATQAAHGTAAISGDGSFTYTPAAGFSGADAFTYSVQLGGGASSTSTVSISVASFPPGDDAYNVDQNRVLTVGPPGVLTNDADGVSGSVAVASQPVHGALALAGDGSFAYTPGLGYNGPDSFTYTVQLEDGSTATATVMLTVVPVPVDAAQYQPVPPARILDTRTSGSKPGKDSTTVVKVTGVGGVPTDGVTAVVVNVTATEATASGFVTAFPAGTERPTASNLNLELAGQTIPNLVTVPVGADGSIALYSQSGTHLVVDVAGYYHAHSGRHDGRFQQITPTRLLDTRSSQQLASDRALDLTVAGIPSVPASASAVVLNVTATNPTAAGYLTVWPTGLAQPLASSVNVDHAGQTIANLVIVPVGADGKVSIYAQNATDVVVDVTGWYTDSTAPASNAGLFVAAPPTRILDTREGRPFENTEERHVPARVEAHESAVVLNITATGARAPGFVTAWPTGTDRPLASNLNIERVGQTIPNASIIGVNDAGSFDLFAQNATDLVVDVNGYFLSE